MFARRISGRPRSAATVLVVLGALLACVAPPAGAAPHWGPPAPPNPYLGPAGTSTMHGDAGSTDVTPLPGPGTGRHSLSAYPLVSACPTLLQGSDRLVVALCTAVAGQVPTVHLIDPAAPAAPFGRSLARFELAKGSLLGGVYAYLDNDNRLVVVDGNRQLLRLGHSRDAGGAWRLTVDSRVDLSGSVPPGDNVTGLTPDWNGNVWFATGGGVVGAVDRAGIAHARALPAGEEVQNSISSSPAGTAVASTHALYQWSFRDGDLHLDWRRDYDRGGSRNPGQLSWGTGSTPTYFGPSTGSDFVAIVDNAQPRAQLRVFHTESGDEVCTLPVLADPGGSENSPVGVGNSVYVAGTYGYPYPVTPPGAGPAEPASAPFTGGMARIDIDPIGCHEVWNNDVRSAAVPRLSTGDGHLYTVIREGPAVTTPLDDFSFVVIDPADGSLEHTSPLPGTAVNDTLQMSGLVTDTGDFWQGTVTGILRIRAE
ncbi:hypothetical protein HYG77_30875 [Rhodococcus sp. ZPP]|uniref:hypothetical protein n=1 Tax=Rhodococcus sp. ZPP TaxID=2749906 RepID=UPI001AD8714C|nr:hypothetical protein [Rhodococcus sp. ZPP]QTJ70078.1 hypothetical protein HYG77_30875 [Rhodococcus sp. ZPP]